MKKFYLYWLTQSLSILGNQITTFALPIWLYILYKDARAVGVVGAIIMVSRVISTPFAGIIVDGSNKKKVLIICELVQLACLILLFFLLNNKMLSWVIGGIFLITSAFETIRFPVIMTLIPQIVQERYLLKANNLFIFSESSAMMIAPLLGGMIMSTYDFKGVIFFDSVTFIISLVFIMLPIFVLVDVQSSNHEDKVGRFHWRNVVLDFKVLFNKVIEIPGATHLLISNIILNFFSMGTLIFLSPMLLSEKFDLNYISKAFFLSAVFQLLINFYITRFHIGFSLKITGIGIILIGSLGFLPIATGGGNIYLTVFGVTVISTVIPFLNSINRSYFQQRIPSNFHGRFFSVRRSISQSTAPLAMIFFSFFIESLKHKTNISGYRLMYFLSFFVIVGVGLVMTFIAKEKKI